MNIPELKRVTGENAETFHRLMAEYACELDKNQGRITDGEILKKWTDSILAKQGEDRFLRLCFSEDRAVGFVYGKVDREGDMGFIRPGYGYVMELYVIPEYRRRGIGRLMTEKLEDHFAGLCAKGIYLTADPVTGKPFWEAMGYICTGERSPENGLYFYEKQTAVLRADEVTEENYMEFAEYAAGIYGENTAPLHGSEIPCGEWEALFSAGDRDERHFIIFMGGAACGYLKVNGLEGSGCGWISLLAVSPCCKRRGVGAFAVGFAEKVLRGEGKREVCINTTADNAPAIRLYEKCGYGVSGRRFYVTGDGVKREGITFSKAV